MLRSLHAAVSRLTRRSIILAVLAGLLATLTMLVGATNSQADPGPARFTPDPATALTLGLGPDGYPQFTLSVGLPSSSAGWGFANWDDGSTSTVNSSDRAGFPALLHRYGFAGEYHPSFSYLVGGTRYTATWTVTAPKPSVKRGPRPMLTLSYDASALTVSSVPAADPDSDAHHFYFTTNAPVRLHVTPKATFGVGAWTVSGASTLPAGATDATVYPDDTVTIGSGPGTLTDVAAPTQIASGAPIVLRAHAADLAHGTPAAGMVQFTMDGAPAGAPVKMTGGSAVLSVPGRGVQLGSHAVAATYVPQSSSPNMPSTSATGSVEVVPGALTFTSLSTPTPAMIEVAGSSTADGAVVDTQSARPIPADNVRWTFLDAGDGSGYGKIVNVATGRCLERNGSTGVVDQWTCGGGNNHQWLIVPATNGGVAIQSRDGGGYLQLNSATLVLASPSAPAWRMDTVQQF